MQDNYKLNTISENEAYILEALRGLKPFEEVRITADKQGKVNNFLIVYSRKVLLTDSEVLPMR